MQVSPSSSLLTALSGLNTSGKGRSEAQAAYAEELEAVERVRKLARNAKDPRQAKMIEEFAERKARKAQNKPTSGFDVDGFSAANFRREAPLASAEGSPEPYSRPGQQVDIYV